MSCITIILGGLAPSLALFRFTNSLVKWIEHLQMVWKIGVQFQVKSYQRLKKSYLMPPCLTLSIIRYGSKVKWNNPGKGVVPSLTPQCRSY